MGVEMLDQSSEMSFVDESVWVALSEPINGTDARRRLEDKLEEQRLRREMQEFDFDFDLDS